MPLGFGPFSFLDPLDPFVPSLYSPSPGPAGSPDMQQAALAPPWASHAPKSLPVPRSSLGFARTPISKTPLGQASPQMLQLPAPLGCGSSASGEKAWMSKDAQTSPLAQMLHPGIRRVEIPQQVRRCPPAALDAQVGRWLIQGQSRGGYLRLTPSRAAPDKPAECSLLCRLQQQKQPQQQQQQQQQQHQQQQQQQQACHQQQASRMLSATSFTFASQQLSQRETKPGEFVSFR